MWDDKFIQQLAQALAARIVPQIQNVNPAKQYPRLMTVTQAAAYLGRSQSALFHLVARREIPCIKHGRNLRFDRVELDKWIDGDKV
jgi:excisionase family DNA binding protein